MDIQREAVIEIVDTQYNGRAFNHKDLKLKQKLVMEHQKDNSCDSNAVLILTCDGKELGFMTKGYASVYAPAIDSGKYEFSVEVVKTEYTLKRPILIVKIISEFNNLISEEDVENDFTEFVQNIVNAYYHNRQKYLKFIMIQNVNIEEIISTLNELRLVYELCRQSKDFIKENGINYNSDEYISFAGETILCNIEEMILNSDEIIKKIRKENDELIDIEYKEEHINVQREILARNYKFRSINKLCRLYYETIKKYAPIIINTAVPAGYESDEISGTPEQMKEGNEFVPAGYESDEISGVSLQPYDKNTDIEDNKPALAGEINTGVSTDNEQIPVLEEDNADTIDSEEKNQRQDISEQIYKQGESIDDSFGNNAFIEQSLPEDSNILMKHNANAVKAYDNPDALNKICEFAINIKPYKMAKIAEEGIRLKESEVFLRKDVPVNGYNRLSNNLQVIAVDNVSDMQIIADEIKRYCQIDNMI